MIKQGKNTIYCDSCKVEIKQTKDLIETKFVKGGINLNFFRCGNCGVKYLVSVTDKETRFKQTELNSMHKKKEMLLNTDNSILNDEGKKEINDIVARLQGGIDRLQEEIKSSITELKKKYEGEL